MRVGEMIAIFARVGASAEQGGGETDAGRETADAGVRRRVVLLAAAVRAGRDSRPVGGGSTSGSALEIRVACVHPLATFCVRMDQDHRAAVGGTCERLVHAESTEWMQRRPAPSRLRAASARHRSDCLVFRLLCSYDQEPTWNAVRVDGH